MKRYVIAFKDNSSYPHFEMTRETLEEAHNVLREHVSKKEWSKIYEADLQLLYDGLSLTTFSVKTDGEIAYILISDFQDIENDHIDHYETVFRNEKEAYDAIRLILAKSTFPIIKTQIFSASLTLIFSI